MAAAERLGFPVMVRPSYVLGGRAMEIVYSNDQLDHYLKTAVKASPDHPVLVDKYLAGTSPCCSRSMFRIWNAHFSPGTP